MFTTDQPKRVQVRQAFTEEAIWRETLGGAEPLLCFVTYGPLDAPDHLPCGAMRASKHGPHQQTTERPGAWF